MTETQQMKAISSFDRRAMLTQTIINGCLVTHFRADDDPLIGHPAGKLVCEPCTPSEVMAYEEQNGDGSCYSETVTRFNRLFWDMGTFTPRS